MWRAVFGGRIARDTLWNLAGRAVPMAIGVLAVPVVVRYLSRADFGLLGLAWAVLGYMTMLDLGIGRATTKYVAASLAAPGAPRLGQVVLISVSGLTGLGVIGGLALVALAPWLAHGVLGLPGASARDAILVFRLLAVAVPFSLLSQALSAVLEGARRFDLVNRIRFPASSLVFLVPAAGAVAGVGVPGIVAVLVLVRVAVAGAMWIAVLHSLPARLSLRVHDTGLLRELAGFSGWVAVSSVLSPLMVYAERFVLASLAGLGPLAYYTPPAEAATRVLVLPSSLANAVFPVFSAAEQTGGRAAARRLAVRAAATLAAVMIVPTLLIVAFAYPLLTLWLGADFAVHGMTALQVLAIGVFANSLGFIPHDFLQATGRPDLTAKLHLVEAPVYAVLVWLMVSRYGIVGAALAWTTRLIADAVALSVLAHGRGSAPGSIPSAPFGASALRDNRIGG